jgi:Tol biopolymer transport system component
MTNAVYPTIGIGNLAWSPDSKSVAFVTSVRGTDGRGAVRKLVLVTPGGPTRLLDVAADSGANVRFTPDGSAVAYTARQNGTTNVVVQPLDGSPARLTPSHEDFAGSLSPDGSQIAVLRQRVDSDVVLLRDGRTRPR